MGASLGGLILIVFGAEGGPLAAVSAGLAAARGTFDVSFFFAASVGAAGAGVAAGAAAGTGLKGLSPDASVMGVNLTVFVKGVGWAGCAAGVGLTVGFAAPGEAATGCGVAG